MLKTVKSAKKQGQVFAHITYTWTRSSNQAYHALCSLVPHKMIKLQSRGYKMQISKREQNKLFWQTIYSKSKKMVQYVVEVAIFIEFELFRSESV